MKASATDLERLLKSIGKSTFVKFYDQFRDTTLSDQDLQDRLPKNYTLKSRISRVSKARRIFREKLEIDALNNIRGSTKVDDETRKLADRVLRR